MPSYSEDLSSGTVPAQIAFTPLALATCQIDLADDSPTRQTTVVRGHNFADELVSRSPGEIVIAAEQFEVGIANAAVDKTDGSESGGPARLRLLAQFDGAVCEMDCDHADVSVCGFQVQTRSSQMLVFVRSEGPAVRKPKTESSKNGFRVRTAL